MFKIKFGWTSLLSLLLLACSGAPNFSLTVPKEISLEQGKSTLVGLSVNPEGGFANTVQLSVLEAPSDVIITFDPPNTRFRTSVKLEAKATLLPDTYTIKLQATAGDISKTADVKLTILTPAFAMTLPNTSLTVDRGAGVESGLKLTRRAGFLGTVGLTLETEDGQPAPAGVLYAFTPDSLTNETDTSVLKINIDKNAVAQPKDFNLRIKARTSDGSSEQFLKFLLKVTNPPNPDFSLSASANSLNFTQLGTQELTVTVNRIGGSEDTVGLTLEQDDGTPLPSGMSAVFDPTSVDKNIASSKLKITVAPGVQNKEYSLQVKGSVGTQNRFFKPLKVKVALEADFVLSAAGTQLTIRQGREDNLDLFVASVVGFNGPVQLKVMREDGTALPTGVSQPIADTVILSPNAVSVRSVKVAVSRDVPVGTYKLRIEGRGLDNNNQPKDPLRVFNFTLVVRPEVDPDFLLTGPLSLDWEDILENKFEFGIGTIRFGSFADPIALKFVDAPASFENLAFAKDLLASTDAGTTLSFNPKQAGEFPLVVQGTAGGITRTVTINVKVRNFNLGFYGNRDENLQPGQNTFFDVTRNIGYQFAISLRLMVKQANGTFEYLTDNSGAFTDAGKALAPEIESISFWQVSGDVGGVVTESPSTVILPGPGNSPIPYIRMRIKIKGDAPAKVLNLRVEGRSQAPAIPGKRGLGELQYRVTDFTINVTP